MLVESKMVNGIKILKFTGQIRISTQEEFKALLKTLARENSQGTAILNMEGIIYMNSTGLGAIIDTYKAFREKKGRLILCNLLSDIIQLFEITKLNHYIEIYDSEEEALLNASWSA